MTIDLQKPAGFDPQGHVEFGVESWLDVETQCWVAQDYFPAGTRFAFKCDRSQAQVIVDKLAEQGIRAELPAACVADTQGVGPEETETEEARPVPEIDPLTIKYMVTEHTAAAIRSRLPTYSEADLEEVCSLSCVGFGPGTLLVLCDMLRVGGYRLAEGIKWGQVKRGQEGSKE